MRIFINGIAFRQGGGVTYLNNFLIELVKIKEIQIDVYGFSKVDSRLYLNKNIRIYALRGVHANLIKRFLFEKFYLSIKLFCSNYDIAFFPCGLLSSFVPKKTKIAVMFTNLLPFSKNLINKFSSFKSRVRYHLLRKFLLSSFRRANLIIFISNYAKSTVRNYVSDIDDRSIVVPHGIAEQFRIKKRFQSNGYMLYVSTLNEYKHQIELVKGLALYKDKTGNSPRLMLVGPNSADYEDRLQGVISKYKMEKEVILKGQVEYARLPELYKKAKLVIFASSCENCPNILLEAMATNTPILCSSFQPMPEFLGNGGIYFNPKDPDSVCEILLKIYNDEDLLKQKAKLAYDRSLYFAWEEAAKKTYKAFQKLIKEKDR